MTTPQVVAVDVGTSAIRAAVLDAEGTVLTSARVARAAERRGEFFSASALLAEVTTALAELATPLGVRALAISAHIGTVALDEDGQAVGDGGGWSDPRGLAELAQLPVELRQDLLWTGRRPAIASGALGYALWLRGNPDLAARVRHLVAPKDFLISALTGEVVTDTVSAAYTMLADVRGHRWNLEAIDELGLDPTWLPRQAPPDQVVGRLADAPARMCGLPAGTPVVAGGPDGSVGLGLLLGTTGSAIADVAGTTDMLGRLLEDAAQAPDEAVVNPALIPGRWVAGGPTGLTGGAAAHWRRLAATVDEAELAAIPPGAEGLQVLPAMTGSRYPRWQATDRGGVLGQRPEHTAAHLLRAAQEGAAFSVREGINLLDPSAELPVVLAGGTARSPATAQLRADVCGRTTLVCAQPDVTLLGAAALALVGSGLVADLYDARDRIGCTFHRLEPDLARAARYQALFLHWCAAREAVQGLDRQVTSTAQDATAW